MTVYGVKCEHCGTIFLIELPPSIYAKVDCPQCSQATPFRGVELHWSKAQQALIPT